MACDVWGRHFSFFPTSFPPFLPSSLPPSLPSFLSPSLHLLHPSLHPSLPTSFPYPLFPSSFFSVLSTNLITVSAKSLLELDPTMKERYSEGSTEIFLITLGGFCPFWKRGKEHSKWQRFPKEKHTLEMYLSSISHSSEVGWPWASLLRATPVSGICFGNMQWKVSACPLPCILFKLYFIKADSTLNFSHFSLTNSYFTLSHSPSLSTLCPPPLSLPPAPLILISTLWNFKRLPTRHKEIPFLCTDSL